MAENWQMRRGPSYLGSVRSARWQVYLLLCGDGTLYAGVTNDVTRRLAAHRAGKGARYTRGRGPLRLVHQEPAPDRSAAQMREAALKKLPRHAKLKLVRHKQTDLDTLRSGQ